MEQLKLPLLHEAEGRRCIDVIALCNVQILYMLLKHAHNKISKQLLVQKPRRAQRLGWELPGSSAANGEDAP